MERTPPLSNARLLIMASALILAQGARGPLRADETAPKEAVDIGSRLELFVDDFLIEELSGAAQRRMHRPDHREVVHVLDKPWEGDTSAYLSVVRDGERILIYYNATPHPRAQTTAVIESQDGVNFTRPSFGMVDFEGSAENNLLPIRRDFSAAGHNFAPFKDPNPEAPEDERFKAISYFRRGGGINAYVSPDGLNWSAVGEEPIVTRYAEDGTRQGAFDSQNVGFWDPVRKMYVCYYRGPDPRGVSRGIWRSVSEDFVNWSTPHPLEYSDDHHWHLYTNGIRPYFRAPHIYIGLPNRFVTGRKKVAEHPNSGINDVVLMSSRDGRLFDRWEEAFIRPGPEPEMWTDRNTYPSWGMAQTSPEELSIYWTEHYRYPGMRFRRGTIRTDGFVSVYANAQGGEMLTRPLVFSGDRLVVNYATSATGEMRFELQDEAGDPLPGFSLGESETLYGNAIEHIVSWRGGSDVSELRGAPVRLRVSFEDAHLYSVRFDASDAIEGRLNEVRNEAAQVMRPTGEEFDRRRRERVAAARERLEQRLAEEDAPTQQTIEAAERLRRALDDLRAVERASAKAREALESARSALDQDAAFGAAYQVAVSLIEERLEDALGDGDASAEDVKALAERLKAAVGDYESARDAQAEASETIASADELLQEPGEGWGLLFLDRIGRRRDGLRAVLADPDATLKTARRAIRGVQDAIAAYREVDTFPAVNPVEVAGAPAVFLVGGEATWQRGLLVHARADGDGLIPSDKVAVRFAGEGAYVQCPASDALKPDTVTVEAWLKIEDEYLSWFPILVLGKDLEAELEERRPAWTEHAYSLWAHGNRPQFTLGSEDGSTLVRTRRGPTVETGAWQHVAGTFDGAEARFYINGELVDTAEYEGAVDYHWSDALRIGGKIGHYDWFVGQIRDVRVWSTVRAEEEIREGMNRRLAGDERGLVGHWIAGRTAGAGDEVFDKSPSGNDGRIFEAKWMLPSGYRLSDPIRFAGISNVQRSEISWQASVEGDETQVSLDVMVGLSDSDSTLPGEWRRAISGERIPFVEAGDDLTGKRLWVKTKLSRTAPGTLVRLGELTLRVE